MNLRRYRSVTPTQTLRRRRLSEAGTMVQHDARLPGRIADPGVEAAVGHRQPLPAFRGIDDLSTEVLPDLRTILRVDDVEHRIRAGCDRIPEAADTWLH